MDKKKYKYMHTLDGKPAEYNDYQIVYGCDYISMVDDLRTIRRQQKLSTEYRKEQGWDIPKYGYVKVYL